MKYFAVLLASCMFMTACSSNNGASKTVPTVNNGGETSTEVDISKLQDQSGNLFAEVDTQVDMGSTSADNLVLTKIVNLKNKGASPVSLTFDALDESLGLTIKVNRCTNALAAGASCPITLSFSARSVFNGPFSGNLVVNGGTNHLTIPVVATIAGHADPVTAAPSLSFTLAGFSSGSGAKRDLIIKNDGPGNASSIIVNLPPGYGIWTNRCSSTLKAHKTCIVTLFDLNLRVGTPAAGSVQITASGHDGPLSIAPIDVLAGGSSSGSVGDPHAIILTRPTGNAQILRLDGHGNPDGAVFCGAVGSPFDTCVYTGDQYNRPFDMSGGTIMLFYRYLPSADPVIVTSSDPSENLSVSSVRNDQDGMPGYELTISGITKAQTLTFSQDSSGGGGGSTDVYGCMDTLATNYNPAANQNDPASCVYDNNGGNTCNTGYQSSFNGTCYGSYNELQEGDCNYNAQYWSMQTGQCYMNMTDRDQAECNSYNKYWDTSSNTCFDDLTSYEQYSCLQNPDNHYDSMNGCQTTHDYECSMDSQLHEDCPNYVAPPSAQDAYIYVYNYAPVMDITVYGAVNVSSISLYYDTNCASFVAGTFSLTDFGYAMGTTDSVGTNGITKQTNISYILHSSTGADSACMRTRTDGDF